MLSVLNEKLLLLCQNKQTLLQELDAAFKGARIVFLEVQRLFELVELSIDLSLDVRHQSVIELQIGHILQLFFFFSVIKCIDVTNLSALLPLKFLLVLQLSQAIQEVRTSLCRPEDEESTEGWVLLGNVKQFLSIQRIEVAHVGFVTYLSTGFQLKGRVKVKQDLEVTEPRVLDQFDQKQFLRFILTNL